jgi:choline monooxygenase
MITEPAAGVSVAGVLTPLEQACGLPSRLYIDVSTAEYERQRIFFEHWSGIGFAKDLPHPGDAVPINFLGTPLVAVRGRDGAVRVFENVCRHRGMTLVREKATVGPICCPYHAWCYDLTGKLLATPNVGGPGINTHSAIDRSKLGLLEVRSAIWRDVIFVNLSATAPAFDVAHAPLMERWRELEQPLYAGGAESSFTLTVRSNWKLAVENYLESYHLPTVHPRLNSYSPLSVHYNIAEYGRFSGQGTRSYTPTLDDSGARLADFPHLSSQWDTGAEYLVAFPNVLLGVHRDHTFAIVLEPREMELTLEHVSIYYASAQMQADPFASLRAKNAALWRTVFEEDVGVVEGMQRGRHAPSFDGGRFSPVMDSPTHVFHHWVASQWSR